MPRTARLTPGGVVYHCLNRANARLKIFSSAGDYKEFADVVHEALKRVPVRLVGWCLMPDHWHLVIWPRKEGDLSEFMRWLSVTHTRRWHARRNTSGTGHLYQGRYRSFPVEPDHVADVCRYIESNPVRAKLVRKAANWEWSSLSLRLGRAADAEGPELSEGPIAFPKNYPALVDAPIDEKVLAALRMSAHRGTPFGSPAWQKKTALRLNLGSTMRARGRPRIHPIVEKPASAEVVKKSQRARRKK